MVFWITSRMKAKREQVDDKLMVIKLFASNYARDLLYTYVKLLPLLSAALTTYNLFSIISIFIGFFPTLT